MGEDHIEELMMMRVEMGKMKAKNCQFHDVHARYDAHNGSIGTAKWTSPSHPLVAMTDYSTIPLSLDQQQTVALPTATEQPTEFSSATAGSISAGSHGTCHTGTSGWLAETIGEVQRES